MKKLSMLALVLMLVGLAGASVASAASVLNLATHPVGNLTNMAGTGVAAVVNKYSPVQLKVKAVAGPTTWLPMMASREIELGIFTSADAYPAYLGEEAYEKLSGGKGFDIRLAGTGMVLSLGTIVSGNVPAKTMAELKGLKVCGNYANVPSAQVAMTAVLANGGLTWDDVKMVPVPHPGAAVKAVMEGRADAGWASLGMPAVRELDAKRGARFIGLDISPEALARKDKYHPYSFPKLHKAGTAPGLATDTWMVGVENYMACRADIADEDIYQINKALWEHYEELGAFHPNMKSWNQKNFVSKKLFIPYHPGAIKFLKEKGLWTDALEARNKELLGMKK
ncbi:MAG: TAXI family TRAP transporter solute-binding subunit [Desulfobacterales bacterium]|nr:TAXI family TRAP transporter solute-binding subunit [Desulfobacterales bacterium]